MTMNNFILPVPFSKLLDYNASCQCKTLQVAFADESFKLVCMYPASIALQLISIQSAHLVMPCQCLWFGSRWRLGSDKCLGTAVPVISANSMMTRRSSPSRWRLVKGVRHEAWKDTAHVLEVLTFTYIGKYWEVELIEARGKFYRIGSTPNNGRNGQKLNHG